MLRIRRVYERPEPADGYRVLVDRLWPRGVRKEAARLDAWMRDVAPSPELRQWFGHDPAKWPDFRARYRAELGTPEARAHLAALAERARQGTVTLLYAAQDGEHNNAAVLAEVLAVLVDAASTTPAD